MNERVEQREAGRALDAEVAERVFGATGRTMVRQSWPCPASDEFVPAYNMGIHGEPLRIEGALTLEREKHFTADDGGRLTGGIGMYFAKPFSTDLASAFLVVEAMRGLGLGVEIEAAAGSGWTVVFYSALTDYTTASGETLPLAICLAALNALAAHTPDEAAVETSSPTPSQP